MSGLVETGAVLSAGKSRTRHAPAETPRAQVIKAALLEDTATAEEIATTFGVTTRTVRRWNLPYVTVGMVRHYLLRAAREKIMRRQRGGDPPPPRCPGRPRKKVITTAA